MTRIILFGIVLLGLVLSSGCISFPAIDEVLACPASCDDGNSCTTDRCSASTDYSCVNEPIASCCGNNVCEAGEDHNACPVDCEAPRSTVEDLKKSVVSIDVEIETCCDYDGQSISYVAGGAGVIYPLREVVDYYVADDEWVVVTNRHVVDCLYTGECTFGSSQDITIKTVDGFRYTPIETFFAPNNIDIAFLVFRKNPRDSARVANIDRTHIPNVGDDVYAIGNPSGGIPWTLTRGIVSNLGEDPFSNVDVIQTDTAINPGNSGGGLFDKETGKLLGINTWKWVGVEGIGYAIDSYELIGLAKDALYCEDSRDALLGSVCMDCNTGEILSEEGECVDPCYFDNDEFTFFYCPDGTYCDEGSCYSGSGTDDETWNVNCPAGYVLGQDDYCHEECGTGMYCVDDDAWCYFGRCVTCDDGYYLGVDGYCYPY